MRERIFKWYLKKPQNNCFHAVRKIQLFFTALIATPHPLHHRQIWTKKTLNRHLGSFLRLSLYFYRLMMIFFSKLYRKHGSVAISIIFFSILHVDTMESSLSLFLSLMLSKFFISRVAVKRENLFKYLVCDVI